MVIMFSSTQFERMCNEQKQMVRKCGSEQAKLLRRRLDQLRSADCLEDLRHLPGPRCHELTANRKGQLAVDLNHPYRLVFRPTTNPLPQKPDGGLDWSKVDAIEILGIVDYHE